MRRSRGERVLRLSHCHALLIACLLSLSGSLPPRAAAQIEDMLPSAPSGGSAVTPDEMTALALAESGQVIAAREKAEAILKDHPESFMAHLVLGKVLRDAEASYPRALFHLERARSLYEQVYGPSPPKDLPWELHALILQQLSETEGDLEHHKERLDLIARFNKLYDPDMIAEQAWPLMKLGRYEEAKSMAELGLAQADRPLQRLIALNALCAIEFEAGKDGASYDACKRAVDDARGQGRLVSAVDLTNLSEAARSLFRLDEAERYALSATEAPVSYYGNPWLDLAEIYTREGRFTEALSALKQIPAYRAERPPETRMSDMNESRRALSALLLTVSRAEEAQAMTAQALVRPDRRAHHSRDEVQDAVVSALLDRGVRNLRAQLLRERASTEPWLSRVKLQAQALWHEVSAWHSGHLAARMLDTEARLFGVFRIGTASAAIMPPWLAGELVAVLGAGVTEAALSRARSKDQRQGASAYYDAFEAEALLARGDPQLAQERAQRALSALPTGEVLLRARTHAIAAQAIYQRSSFSAARTHYEEAFQADPGIFRRLAVAIPVRLVVASPDGEEVGDALDRSPRFDVGDEGFLLRVEGAGASLQACLYGAGDAILACGKGTLNAEKGLTDTTSATVASLHAEAFSPRVSLTAADINSLDGSNLVGRDALEDALSQ